MIKKLSTKLQNNVTYQEILNEIILKCNEILSYQDATSEVEKIRNTINKTSSTSMYSSITYYDTVIECINVLNEIIDSINTPLPSNSVNTTQIVDGAVTLQKIDSSEGGTNKFLGWKDGEVQWLTVESGGSYELPIASDTQLGGVKATPKESVEGYQDVFVEKGSGKLYVPKSSISGEITIDQIQPEENDGKFVLLSSENVNDWTNLQNLIETTYLQDHAVTSNKLETGAVENWNIKDGAVYGTKLADNGVELVKIDPSIVFDDGEDDEQERLIFSKFNTDNQKRELTYGIVNESFLSTYIISGTINISVSSKSSITINLEGATGNVGAKRPLSYKSNVFYNKSDGTGIFTSDMFNDVYIEGLEVLINFSTSDNKPIANITLINNGNDNVELTNVFISLDIVYCNFIPYQGT